MQKKLLVFIVLFSVVALAACASLNIPGVGGTSSQPATAGGNTTSGTTGGGQNGFGGDMSKLPLEQKLAIGTFKLEGTPQAVTAKEAADLLPLWKAVKTMASSTTASPTELTALFKQIEDTMTPEQVKAIQDMVLTQADLQTLAQQQGIQFGGGGFGGGAAGSATLDPSARATRVAQFQTQRGAAEGGGAGGNVPGGGGGFGVPGGGAGGGGAAGGQPNAQRTPRPGAANRSTMGMNSIFVNPLITLLQKRAGG